MAVDRSSLPILCFRSDGPSPNGAAAAHRGSDASHASAGSFFLSGSLLELPAIGMGHIFWCLTSHSAQRVLLQTTPDGRAESDSWIAPSFECRRPLQSTVWSALGHTGRKWATRKHHYNTILLYDVISHHTRSYYVYIYIYTYIHICIYIYIYTHIHILSVRLGSARHGLCDVRLGIDMMCNYVNTTS